MTTCVDWDRPDLIFTRHISIGDWTSQGTDADGTRWTLESINWDDTPPVRVSFWPHAGKHGAVDPPGFYGPRVLTFTGAAWAADQYQLAKAKATLRGLAADLNSGVDIVGHMADRDYLVHAKRSADWKITPLQHRGLRYEAQVTCADHRIYSADTHISTATLLDQTGGLNSDLQFPFSFPFSFTPGAGVGVMQVVNAGTTTTDPIIDVYGPGNGLLLSDRASGNYLRITTLAAGQFIRLDTANKAALLMGYQSRRDLLGPGSQWFGLPAGQDTVTFSADVYSTAYAVMTWRDAW